MYRVLEKDPTQDGIRALLRDFKAHLDARGLEAGKRHYISCVE